MEVKLFDSIEDAEAVLKKHEPKLVKANGQNICIVRMENKIVAFENECPHMGASLHQGLVNYMGEIVCPLHTYRFSLRNGQPIGETCGSLRMVPIKIENEVYLIL